MCRNPQKNEDSAPTYVSFRVLDDHQYGTVHLGHLPVQAVEAEAMLARAEDQGPVVALGPGRQVLRQVLPVLLRQYFRVADQIGQHHLRVQRNRALGVKGPPELVVRQHLQNATKSQSWRGRELETRLGEHERDGSKTLSV